MYKFYSLISKYIYNIYIIIYTITLYSHNQYKVWYLYTILYPQNKIQGMYHTTNSKPYKEIRPLSCKLNKTILYSNNFPGQQVVKIQKCHKMFGKLLVSIGHRFISWQYMLTLLTLSLSGHYPCYKDSVGN